MPKEKSAAATARDAYVLPAINGALKLPSSTFDTYNVLREAFDNTMAGIRSEREALRQELKDCMEAAASHAAAMDLAQRAIAQATEKVRAETARIEGLAEDDQKRVDAAQAEFDASLAGEDEKALQKAAEALHAAKTQQQTGSIMQNGLRLRLAGHEAVMARRVQEAEEATARWQDSWEEIRQVELKIALLDADDAMNRALAAHLRVRQVQSTLTQKPFLVGFGGVSFWFSAPHRAVRWNPMLTNSGRREGPVAIYEHTLGALAAEATLPAGAIVPEAD